MRQLFFIAALLSLSSGVYAGCLDGTGYCQRGSGLINIRPALGNLFARSLPTTPLKKGLLEGKISAGIFEVAQDKGDDYYRIKQKLPGSGGSVGMLYGLSEHWGITALAGYAASKGKYTGVNQYGIYPTTPPTSGKPEEKALNAAVNLVWDPFSGDNFRMPIMLGLSYMKYSEEMSVPFTIYTGALAGHSAVMTEEYDYNEFGYAVGIAPQFNTGKFRWVPFFFNISAVNKDKRRYTEKDLSTGQVFTSAPNTDESGSGCGGIQLVYRPWNLSYSYVVPQLSDLKVSDGDTMSSHTISYSRKF